jgi:hypothetical protein
MGSSGKKKARNPLAECSYTDNGVKRISRRISNGLKVSQKIKLGFQKKLFVLSGKKCYLFIVFLLKFCYCDSVISATEESVLQGTKLLLKVEKDSLKISIKHALSFFLKA